jgi:hypothetical protein
LRLYEELKQISWVANLQLSHLTMSKSPLRVLADILSDAVDRIDSQYSAANLSFPTLDDPFDPEQPADILLGHQAVVEQAKIVVGVADQLCAMVTNPSSGLMEVGMAVSSASAVQPLYTGCRLNTFL